MRSDFDCLGIYEILSLDGGLGRCRESARVRPDPTSDLRRSLSAARSLRPRAARLARILIARPRGARMHVSHGERQTPSGSPAISAIHSSGRCAGQSARREPAARSSSVRSLLTSGSAIAASWRERTTSRASTASARRAPSPLSIDAHGCSDPIAVTEREHCDHQSAGEVDLVVERPDQGRVADRRVRLWPRRRVLRALWNREAAAPARPAREARRPVRRRASRVLRARRRGRGRRAPVGRSRPRGPGAMAAAARTSDAGRGTSPRATSAPRGATAASPSRPRAAVARPARRATLTAATTR